MTPWKHAESSAAKWGGTPYEYFPIHNWLDETKQYTGDWTHRALRHHSAGVEWASMEFGPAIENSDGNRIPVKLIAEQHIMEDCGCIPTPHDYLKLLKDNPENWMIKVAKKKTTTKLETV